jgi:hypothetical protein
MKRILFPSVAFLVVTLFGVDAVAAPVESKFDVKLGGYVKLDYITQDATLGPLATLTTVEPGDEDTDESIFTARQSRLNLIITGPEYLGAKTRAFVEGDFYGPGGTNSSGNFRMRHANFTLDWEEKGTQLMFGQFWDIFAPFAASTLDFGTGNTVGAPNNPRVAQARLTQKVSFNEDNWLTVIAGVQDPVEDAEESKANVAGQVMFNSKALGVSPGYWGLPMQPLIVGVFGLYGEAEDDATGEDYDVWGAGVYTHIPVLSSNGGKSRAGTLTFEGQAYIAEGLDAQKATATGTIGGTAAELEAAEGYGAIAQLIYYPTQPLGITVGYGQRGIVDTENYRNKKPGAEEFNGAAWANVTYDVNNVRFGLEYMKMETAYLGGDDLDANRFQFSAMYFF